MLDRLRSLSHEKPRTKAGQVRWALAEIQAARAAGHNLKAICHRLNEVGIEVSYRQFIVYLNRLRREELRPGRQVVPQPPPAPERNAPPERLLQQRASAEAPSPDPVDALRKQLQRRPGFEYNSQPDKSKLI